MRHVFERGRQDGEGAGVGGGSAMAIPGGVVAARGGDEVDIHGRGRGGGASVGVDGGGEETARRPGSDEGGAEEAAGFGGEDVAPAAREQMIHGDSADVQTRESSGRPSKSSGRPYPRKKWYWCEY